MERPQLKADYIEKIEIQPEDIIPKSSWFKCVKYTLISLLLSMIIIAIIAIIVAESFLERSYLAVGIISLLGIILFLIGLIAIIKEHVPCILIFAVSMIFYLLLLMYSRIFDTAGWIILRTSILACLILLTIIYCILIRDWRQLQVSRLRQRAIKEVTQQYGLSPLPPPSSSSQHYYRTSIHQHHNHQLPNHLMPANYQNNPNHHQYEQIENIYSQISSAPSSSSMTAKASNHRTPGVILTTHYN
ncbi:hypothetical protein HUG17_8700 [Dermatophagoides farinae]|uniref:Uncharacterized protein n=1 Tax=Dermatophagoides farinae TaxID=6954 RepID=A0A9D4SDB4_DERFA|nr:uncharacterized protein LOC124496971 [Dermatophagoides farinae]KAH7637596.1 hypothetical protein HUG17_8700 [Dermatophagoides farinae]